MNILHSEAYLVSTCAYTASSIRTGRKGREGMTDVFVRVGGSGERGCESEEYKGRKEGKKERKKASKRDRQTDRQ